MGDAVVGLFATGSPPESSDVIMPKQSASTSPAKRRHSREPQLPGIRQHCQNVRRTRDGRVIRMHPAEQLRESASTPATSEAVSSAAEQSGRFCVTADTLEDQLLEDARACLAAIRVTGDSDKHAAAKSQRRRSSAGSHTNTQRQRATDRSGLAHVSPVTSTLRPATQSAAKMPTSRASAKVRVQLRLSKAMVTILKGFQQTGRAPSAIVERALWRDSSIRDAAAILRVER